MKQERERIFAKGQTFTDQLQFFAEKMMNEHQVTMQEAARITCEDNPHPAHNFYSGAAYGIRELARLLIQGDITLTSIVQDKP